MNEWKRQALVACNVYISAGGRPCHHRLLKDLLAQATSPPTEAQLSGRRDHHHHHHNNNNNNNDVVVVHAYTDPVYNRSSFHLVGQSSRSSCASIRTGTDSDSSRSHTTTVATVASALAVHAVQALTAMAAMAHQDDNHPHTANGTTTHDHPTVGLVDHVSVLPLLHDDDDDTVLSSSSSSSLDAAGRTARQIGATMTEALTQKDNTAVFHVHYYGSAHPETLSLARVRRERTHFFQHRGGGGGGVLDTTDHEAASTAAVACVGAPARFVENYNVRLRKDCSQALARDLTRTVRERDGGLDGVEALTLPYSDGRWEVACNMLDPAVAGAEDIQRVVDEWDNGRGLVELGYRVGTTADQCLEAWRFATASKENRALHDRQVAARLERYLNDDSDSTHDSL